MSLSKAEHRNGNLAKWSKFKVEQSVNVNPVEFINNQEQRKAFKEFLQKRQVLLVFCNKGMTKLLVFRF